MITFITPRAVSIPMAEVAKLCTVCAVGVARHTCMLCGRLVCPSCYEPVDGVCKMCAKTPRSKRPADPYVGGKGIGGPGSEVEIYR